MQDIPAENKGKNNWKKTKFLATSPKKVLLFWSFYYYGFLLNKNPWSPPNRLLFWSFLLLWSLLLWSLTVLTKKLFLACASDSEIWGFVLASDEVHTANVGLRRFGVQPSYHRVDEERTEPPLVQHVGQHCKTQVGCYFARL